METNRQKKIGALLQNDLVSILQGEIRKNNINNLVISVSKVNVTSDLSIAKVHLSIFPTDKAAEILRLVLKNKPEKNKWSNADGNKVSGRAFYQTGG